MGLSQSLQPSSRRELPRTRKSIWSERPWRRSRRLLEELESRVLLTVVGPEAPAGYAYTQNIANAPLLSNSNAINDYILNYYHGSGTANDNGPIDFGVDIGPGASTATGYAPINMVHGNGNATQVKWTPVNLVSGNALTETINVPMPLNADGSINLTLEGESYDPNPVPTGVPEGNAQGTSNILTATESGTTVTITATAALNGNLKVNTPVTIAGVGVAGYNGTFGITSVNAATNSFTYTDAGTSNMASSSAGTATSISNGGDSKLLIYDEDNKVLYELYHASRPTELWGAGYAQSNTTGQWYAEDKTSGFTSWNLNTSDYESGNMTAGGTSYALLEGRPDELPANPSTGTLGHALYFELPKNTWVEWENIFPGLRAAGAAATNPDAPIYAGRLRLKAGLDISGLTPDQQCIVNTLQQYGAYLVDTYGVGSQADIVSMPYSLDANNQNPLTWGSNFPKFNLPISDFEWVDQSPQVTSISTSGSTVTINGKNFQYGQPITTLGTFSMNADTYPTTAHNTSPTEWYGAQIKVGAKPIIVTDIGRYVFSGNTGTHQVEIVNAAGTVIGGPVTIDTSKGTAGSFRYGQLTTSITLSANTTYYLVSSETQGADVWDDGNTKCLPTASFTITGTVKGSGTTWTTAAAANYEFGPVNLLYKIQENSPGLSVLFGGTPQSPNLATNVSVNGAGTQITATIPSGSGTVNVQVMSGVAFNDVGWRTNINDPGPAGVAIFGYGISKQYMKYVYGSGSTEAADTAPPPVTNLIATAGNNSVTLNWSAPIGTSNVSTDPAYVTYDVFRGTIGGFESKAYGISGSNGATESGTTVTITTGSLPPGIAVGQTAMITGVSNAAYNGTFTITSVGTNSFTYTNPTSGLAASGNGNVYIPVAFGLTAATFTDNSVSNANTYYYEVVAVNSINANPGLSSTTQFYPSKGSNEVAVMPMPTPAATVQDPSFESDSIATVQYSSGPSELTGFSSYIWVPVAHSTTLGDTTNFEPNWGTSGNIPGSNIYGTVPWNPSSNHATSTIAGVWNPNTDTWGVNLIGTTLTNTAIGSPGGTDNSSYSGTTKLWTVNGGGTGIGGTSDSFDFASNSITWKGGSIMAEIASVPSTGKAGVMWRDGSNAANAINGFVWASGTTVGFTYRSSTGGSTSTVATATIATGAPVWVKLNRGYNGYFDGWYSTDGATWHQLGGSVSCGSIAATTNVGLAVTATDPSNVNTATATFGWTGNANPFPNGGYNGTNVAWVDAPASGSNWNGIVQQTNITSLTAGTTYTLTVGVGDRSDAAFGGYQITLEYGSVDPVTGALTVSQVLQQVTSATAPVAGGFGDVTVSYTAPSNLSGGHLLIVLATNPASNATVPVYAGVYNQTRPQTDFDNVRLTTQVSGDIVIDDTFNDATSNLLQYDGGTIGWTFDGTALSAGSPGYVYVTTPYGDYATLGNANVYQNDSYVLPSAVDTLRITLYNANATTSAAAFSSGAAAMSWYDSTQFTGGVTSTGRHTGITITGITRPTIAPGQTIQLDIPLSGFANGGMNFGDAGDAFGYLQLQDILRGSGLANGDLRITGVDLVHLTPNASIAKNADAAEGGSNGQFTVTLNSAPSSNVTVNYAIAGTATNGTDYNTLTGSVTIASGHTTGTITLSPVDDPWIEGTETVQLTLTSGTGYIVGASNQATLNIADNDAGDIIDNTYNDTTSNLAQHDGGTIGWTFSGMALSAGNPGYVYTNTPYTEDVTLGSANAYQNDAYVLPTNVTTLRVILYNANTTTTAAAYSSISAAMSWYDSTQYTGGATGAGRHTAITATGISRPAIAPGQTIALDIPLSAFADGGMNFGDAGDAVGFLQLQDLLRGSGLANGDLRLIGVEFIQ